MTIYLNPFSVVLIFCLIPISAWVQYKRKDKLTTLLDLRQRAERKVCVCVCVRVCVCGTGSSYVSRSNASEVQWLWRRSAVRLVHV